MRIVNANMMRAIRVVSIERGHDPRTFTLMPFGGAGALHAVEIARELGIRSILVPPAPGILCAEGVAAAELEESFVATCRVPLDGDLAPRRGALRPADRRGRGMARARALDPARRPRHDIAVDMRYVGQNFELAIPVPQAGRFRPPPGCRRAFLDAHQRKYGHHDPDAAVEIVNVRLSARKAAREARRDRHPRMTREPRRHPRERATRPVWFAADTPTDTRFIDRGALAPGAVLEGPADRHAVRCHDARAAAAAASRSTAAAAC